jgi:hypothetical protein
MAMAKAMSFWRASSGSRKRTVMEPDAFREGGEIVQGDATDLGAGHFDQDGRVTGPVVAEFVEAAPEALAAALLVDG